MILSNLLIVAIAVLHVWFMVLEMFLWQTDYGRKSFGTTQEQAKHSAVLAANQGLYNGFLVAGLVWAVLSQQLQLKIFFLTCVLIAGIFGAATASRKILFVQALPALIALGSLL